MAVETGTLSARLKRALEASCGDADLADTLESKMNAIGDASAAEGAVLDGATAGTVVASKAVVVDANKDAQGFNEIGVLDTLRLGADLFGLKVVEIDVVTATMLDGNENDTGVDLPDSGIVLDMWMKVNTGHGSAATVDVGFLNSESSGDADGFGDALDVETAGIVHPSLAGAVAAATRGALMRDAADDDAGDTVQVPAFHVLNGTNKSVSVTSSADISGGAADITLYFLVMTQE